MNPFYRGEGNLTILRVVGNVATLKEFEKELRPALQNFLDNGYLSEEKHPEQFKAVREYLMKDYAYFIDDTFQNHELNELVQATVSSHEIVNTQKFEQYLSLQLELANLPMD